MFWDFAAGFYQLFEDIVNGNVNRQLCKTVAAQIRPQDVVLECACGTGMISKVIAPRCRHLTATDLSVGMLRQTKKTCAAFRNVTVKKADILHLKAPDHCFDAVVAGNVIHLLDDPQAALKELTRVCKPDGRLIIPTYINEKADGSTSLIIRLLSKLGADFKRQFTAESYRQFFLDAGFPAPEITIIKGRIPCAVAVLGDGQHAGSQS